MEYLKNMEKLPKLFDDCFSEEQIKYGLEQMEVSGMIKRKIIKSNNGGDDVVEIELQDSAFKYYLSKNSVPTGNN